MTNRFNKAYDALVNAFFNGTLAKGDCKACAVGNIVASGMGGDVKRQANGKLYCTAGSNTFWNEAFYTPVYAARQVKLPGMLDKELNEKMLSITGYSLDEIAKVEHAFEVNTSIDHNDYEYRSEQEILEDQYKGLCAVVDVLLQLDAIPAEPHYKAKFRQHKALQS